MNLKSVISLQIWKTTNMEKKKNTISVLYKRKDEKTSRMFETIYSPMCWLCPVYITRDKPVLRVSKKIHELFNNDFISART